MTADPLPQIQIRPATEDDHAPAHLEASTQRNRALYERHGFSLTGSFDLPRRRPAPARDVARAALSL